MHPPDTPNEMLVSKQKKKRQKEPHHSNHMPPNITQALQPDNEKLRDTTPLATTKHLLMESSLESEISHSVVCVPRISSVKFGIPLSRSVVAHGKRKRS